jgi:hypothetical protein
MCIGLPGIDVDKFISTFKTRACTDEKHHDWFQCPFFHGKVDKRRDPFEVAYLPDDAGLTGTEKAYHPVNFRTKYCETFSRARKCKYGAYCAFAHADNEVRQATRYEEVMKQKLYPSKPLPQVREFLPDLAQSVVQPPEVLRPGCPDPAEQRVAGVAVFLPLRSFEVKVLRHPKMTLWKQFVDVAVEYMCKINLEILEESDGVSLKIQGQEQNARSARSKLENQLRPLHKKYGETGTKPYPQKVMGLLFDLLEKDGPERFTERKDFELVEIHLDLEKRQVEVCALALPEVTRPMQVFHRIDRWIRDNEYDTTMNCGSCMDDFNKREGAVSWYPPQRLVWRTEIGNSFLLKRQNQWSLWGCDYLNHGFLVVYTNSILLSELEFCTASAGERVASDEFSEVWLSYPNLETCSWA